jgi:hypothetical protein
MASANTGDPEMRNVILSVGMVIALAPVAVPRTTHDAPRLEAQTTSDAQVLADFQMRVQQYVEVHRRLEGPVPTVAVSEDWAEIKAAIEALATEIRAARTHARRGDIFTPDIERLFRRRIRECLEGCNIEELLATLNEENPPDLVLTPRVNGRWPEEASLGPMPPKLLAGLPPLPDELQYRFMNRDLVLWDVHANVVVDLIKRAMP